MFCNKPLPKIEIKLIRDDLVKKILKPGESVPQIFIKKT